MYIFSLTQSRDPIEIRGPGLPPSEHHLPRCLSEPKRAHLGCHDSPMHRLPQVTMGHHRLLQASVLHWALKQAQAGEMSQLLNENLT